MTRYSVFGNRAPGSVLYPAATLALVIAVLWLLAGCGGPAEDPRVELAAIVPLRPDSEAFSPPHFTATCFVTADGQCLPLRTWLPAGPPKAAILALHGFNDYSAAFAGPAAFWARRGIATYAYDQRGFGDAPDRGRWAGRAALAADAASASQVLRASYPRLPIYLLGESMGGAVAVVAMTGESGTPLPAVDGVILAAPAVWGRATMSLVPRLALWAGVRIAPAMTLTGRGLEIRPSDNIAMLRALSRDPLVIKATRIDTIYGLVDLMDAALASAPRLNAPLLLMYGADDEIVPRAPVRRFVSELPPDRGADRRLALYPHGYHMLLRDLDGAVAVDDVASWVLTPAAPLPSGADRVEAGRPWPPDRDDGS